MYRALKNGTCSVTVLVAGVLTDTVLLLELLHYYHLHTFN
jgi:hypothetical protein